jgi:hypothetical protein
MSTEKETPAIGKGSPAGPRWFVSRHPGLTLEVKAEQMRDREGNRAKFIRIGFNSEAKSAIHVGAGRLGTGNPLGTDTNSHRQYGLFFIIDPGPRPKDGYKADEDPITDEQGKVHEDWMRTAEQKEDDRYIIDHFRKTSMYRATPQKNEYLVTGRLIELNWDPAEIRVAVQAMVIPGMGRPMARPTLAGAPEESFTAAPSSKSPVMGTKVSRRNVPA